MYRKTITRMLALLAATLATSYAMADTVLWVYYPGYCNVKEITFTDNYSFYGREVGCSSSYGKPMVGSFDLSSGHAWVSTSTNSGNPTLDVYRSDGYLMSVYTDAYGATISYGTTLPYIVSATQPYRVAKSATEAKAMNAAKPLPDMGH